MSKIIPNVILDLKAKTKQDAMRELSELLFSQGKLLDHEKFLDDLTKREEIMSTYCGYHMSIPHSESDFVKEASIAFGRSEGITWDEGDDQVYYVIILAIPKSEADSGHIELMSTVATLALEDEIREKWKIATSREEIVDSFKI